MDAVIDLSHQVVHHADRVLMDLAQVIGARRKQSQAFEQRDRRVSDGAVDLLGLRRDPIHGAFDDGGYANYININYINYVIQGLGFAHLTPPCRVRDRIAAIRGLGSDHQGHVRLHICNTNDYNQPQCLGAMIIEEFI